MPAPRPSPTVIAFLLTSILVGLVTLGVGLLATPADAEGPVVIECATFPVTLNSTSLFRFAAVSGQAAHLEVDFLEIDGDIIQTRQLDLVPGATTTFSMPTHRVGIAIQVIASAPVEVETAYVYQGSGGVLERRMVPCKHITDPVRGGGP